MCTKKRIREHRKKHPPFKPYGNWGCFWLYDKKFQNQHCNTACNRYAKQAFARPCKNECDYESRKRGVSVLRCRQYCRKGHDRERHIGNIIQKRAYQLALDFTADKRKRQNAYKICYRRHAEYVYIYLHFVLSAPFAKVIVGKLHHAGRILPPKAIL